MWTRESDTALDPVILDDIVPVIPDADAPITPDADIPTVLNDDAWIISGDAVSGSR